jgi:hypothetical protein
MITMIATRVFLRTGAKNQIGLRMSGATTSRQWTNSMTMMKHQFYLTGMRIVNVMTLKMK